MLRRDLAILQADVAAAGGEEDLLLSGDDDAFDPISDYRLDAAAANATDAA